MDGGFAVRFEFGLVQLLVMFGDQEARLLLDVVHHRLAPEGQPVDAVHQTRVQVFDLWREVGGEVIVAREREREDVIQVRKSRGEKG